MTSADLLLVDTSVALGLLDAGDLEGARLREVVAGRPLGLSGHAAFETYSVLTRLPSPRRVSARAAALLIERTFPQSYALKSAGGLVAEFAALGIDGGSVYDGLVAAAARERGVPLLTRDLRAERTYRLIGVDIRVL